jgi:hypothetical protein
LTLTSRLSPNLEKNVIPNLGVDPDKIDIGLHHRGFRYSVIRGDYSHPSSVPEGWDLIEKSATLKQETNGD